MNKKIVLILALLVAALGMGASYCRAENTAALPQHASVKVQRMTLEDVVTSLGTLEPTAYVDVGAQISGQIIRLHVELGSTVKKGDLLAEID